MLAGRLHERELILHRADTAVAVLNVVHELADCGRDSIAGLRVQPGHSTQPLECYFVGPPLGCVYLSKLDAERVELSSLMRSGFTPHHDERACSCSCSA